LCYLIAAVVQLRTKPVMRLRCILGGGESVCVCVRALIRCWCNRACLVGEVHVM
jgi:hypothetical protein